MAVPKRKTSKSKTKMRHANKGFKLNHSVQKCKNCYSPSFQHILCRCAA